MPPKRCSNKAPVSQRETNPLTCFKKGIKVGVRLEAQKREREAQARDRPALNTLSIRRLADMGRVYKIPNYGKMRKAQLIEALQRAGYPRGP